MILETGPSAVTFFCYFSLFYYCFSLLSFLGCFFFFRVGGVVLSLDFGNVLLYKVCLGILKALTICQNKVLGSGSPHELKKTVWAKHLPLF